VCVVVVADEIRAALHLRSVRTKDGGIGGRGVRSERGLVCRDRARAAEVGVRVIDAGVDDRDSDAFAADARGAGPRDRRLDAWHAHHVFVFERSDTQHVDDTRHLPERLDLVARNNDLDPVDGALEAADDAGTGRLDLPARATLLARAL